MSKMQFIEIPRGLQKTDFWNNSKPFDKRAAFIDLFFMAEDETGEIFTSYRGLSIKWQWNRSKVRRFLEKLQENKIIEYEADISGTHITINKEMLHAIW